MVEVEAVNALPAEEADAVRDTLGGATEVAVNLPPEIGGPVLDAAREAFTAGMQLAALTGAVLLGVMAVVTAVVLRHNPPAGHAEQPAGQPATVASENP